jgi:uncharacterized membrane protein YqiK
MSSIAVLTLTLVVTMGATFLGGALFIAKTYRRVEPDEALLVSTTEGLHVVLEKGALVMPVFHKADTIGLSLRTFDFSRTGSRGFMTADDTRIDVVGVVYLCIPRDEDAIRSIAQDIGVGTASDPDALRELFMPKLEQALAAAVGESRFEDLYKERGDFRDRVLQHLDGRIGGFQVEDVALEHIEKTPKQHDTDNTIRT